MIDPTKSPWEVRPSLVRDVLGQPCGFDVYDSAGDRIGYQLDGPTASLVAAAPDMREALEWIANDQGREVFDTISKRTVVVDRDAYEYRDKARAVLAKLEDS